MLLRAVHTAGHTDDHMALYLEEEAALFSGDCILGQTRPVFEDMGEYVRSLQRIKGLATRRIYPGHGPVIADPSAKVAEYFRNIGRRERLMVDALKAIGAPVATLALVQRMYSGLSLAKRIGAAIQVRNHLAMLAETGIVRKTGMDSWILLGRHYAPRDYGAEPAL